MRGHEQPRSSSSCAACKLLKRRCTPSCIFAPYFRSDEPKKFAKVHKVFGASNVSKILIEVPEEQREDTVNSLAYEAEARLRDPVYGCIGAIAILQRKMAELQHDLAIARARLARIAATSSTTTTTTTTTVVGSGGVVLDDQLNGMVPLGDYYFGSCSGLGANGSFYSASSEWGDNGGMNNEFGQSPFLL